MEAHGVNGQLEVTNSVVRIKRSGILSFLSQGLKGDKEILLSKISSIQLKKVSFFTNGYIQFTFAGGQEAKGGLREATRDENTVIFNADQQASFEKLRDELQKKSPIRRAPLYTRILTNWTNSQPFEKEEFSRKRNLRKRKNKF